MNVERRGWVYGWFTINTEPGFSRLTRHHHQTETIAPFAFFTARPQEEPSEFPKAGCLGVVQGACYWHDWRIPA